MVAKWCQKGREARDNDLDSWEAKRIPSASSSSWLSVKSHYYEEDDALRALLLYVLSGCISCWLAFEEKLDLYNEWIDRILRSLSSGTVVLIPHHLSFSSPTNKGHTYCPLQRAGEECIPKKLQTR